MKRGKNLRFFLKKKKSDRRKVIDRRNEVKRQALTKVLEITREAGDGHLIQL